MPTEQIVFKAVVGQGAGQYYGTIVVSGIQYDDGSAVIVDEFLSVSFLSPAEVKKEGFIVLTVPWAEITPEVTNEDIGTAGEKKWSVKAKLRVDSKVSMSGGGTITIGINGDLTKKDEPYTKSFVLAADVEPDNSGTVNVNCAASPDPALDGQKQAVTFTMGGRVVSVKVPLGEESAQKVPAGTYTVTVAPLATDAETVVVAAQVDPTSVKVEAGGTAQVNVTYGTVAKHSAIDLTIGDILPLQKEQFHVTVTQSGKTLAEFLSPNDHTTELRRLPPSGTAEIKVDGSTLNNVKYTFPTKDKELSQTLIAVFFREDDLEESPVDTKGFVKLPIVVRGDVRVESDVSVRLTSSPLVYTQTIKAAAGTTDFHVPVAPGNYTVQAKNIIHKGIVYVVSTAANLTVADDGSTKLELTLQRGANLKVMGFPSFLSFGGCTDLVPGNQADFVMARASSVFKYAGNDGAGDAAVYLADDPATTKTIALARAVEQQLDDDNQVLPVMISYTCNMSGGNPADHLRNDEEGLAHSFANLILSLNIANANKDDDHPVPAGYLVNPDFIGACQQDKLTPDYQMGVRDPLATAMKHWDIVAEIPESISNDLRGYVLAVNWLFRTVAPSCTFGWQVNLWGVGSSQWIYGTEDVAQIARQTGDFAKALGVFDEENRPDFLAVDRYEADDFTVRSYGNGYCYGPREWDRFFDFCAALSAQLQIPIMAWQIPSSWTPLTTDLVNDDFDSQHWGTGGSYMLGDAGINSDYHNVNRKILELPFNPALTYMGTKAQDIFTSSEPFDLTHPMYVDFPRRGIFTVLLGGGSTTGIVSSIGNPQPWARKKLHAYMKHPIHFDKQEQ